MVSIRNATMEDAERLLEIYGYYVDNTAITFEFPAPTLDEFKVRMEKTMSRYPCLASLPYILTQRRESADLAEKSTEHWKKPCKRWEF